MIRIRLIYDDDREAAEVIRLLAPRLNYCRMPMDAEPQKAYLGIKTADLLVDEEDDTEGRDRYGGV